MYRFLVTLHVLSAVLLVGPFAFAAFAGHRAISRHDADATRAAGRWLSRFAAASVVVFLLGAAAVGSSNRYGFRTPWVIISITVWIITMAVATGYAVPALHKAARLLEGGVLERPGAPVGEEPAPTIEASATDLALKQRLDTVAGRIAGSGGIVLLGLAIITVLMTLRPFGK